MRILVIVSIAVVGLAQGQTSNCTLPCSSNGVCKKGVAPAHGIAIHANYNDNESIEDMNSFDFLDAISETEEYCECSDGFVGLLCDVRVHRCDDANHTCFHGGQCVPAGAVQEDNYICDCLHAKDDQGQSYVGKYCEHAATSPCANSDANHFCLHGGVCNGDEPCECQSGFVGDRCEFHVGTIDSNCTMDCQNGGRCSLGFRNKTDAERLFDENEDVTLNFQHCVCPPGYSGRQCETKVDDSCAEQGHYCFHGGECQLQPDTAEPYCDCSIATQEDTRYTGLHCEHAATSFCSLNSGVNGHPFCANGGKCIDLGEGIHECECLEGYHGDRCGLSDVMPIPEPFQECTLPCEPNGVCREGHKDHGSLVNLGDIEHILNTTIAGDSAEHCECKEGWAGVLCNVQAKKCGDKFCFHGSLCVQAIDGSSASCECSESDLLVAGEHCQHKSSHQCTSATTNRKAFCVNGGKCIEKGDEFECECPATHRGKRCEIPFATREDFAPSSSSSSSSSDAYEAPFYVLLSAVLVGLAIAGTVWLRRRRTGKETIEIDTPTPPASAFRDNDDTDNNNNNKNNNEDEDSEIPSSGEFI